MPATYAVSDRSASLTAAGRFAELRTAATDSVFIREIGVSVGVAGAAPTVGIIRPNAIGVTPTSPKTGVAEGPWANGTAQSAVAWTTAPTLPATAIYLRRVGLPATVGAGMDLDLEPRRRANRSCLVLDSHRLYCLVGSRGNGYRLLRQVG
jgi:hypothetical protein